MRKLIAFVAAVIMPMLVSPVTTARSQTAHSPPGSTVSVSEIDNAMDQNLAEQISRAWIEGKDVSGAVALPVRGENAVIQGNPQRARQYFEAAEHELTVLQSSPVRSPSASE